MPREAPLQRYDFEFSFRLDVLAAGAAGERIIEPVKTTDCDGCPWEQQCVPDMIAADCLSLLPTQGYRSWRAMHRADVTTRAEVAALDPATVIIDVSGLPEMIDQALVATRGHGKPHRRRGSSKVEVPHFDLEVDIDMENAIGGEVYLWGVFNGETARTFVSWDEPGDPMEATVFVEFWTWLTRQRDAASRSGKTIGVFCWNETAEKTALRRGAKAASRHLGAHQAPDEVEAFFGSGQLVDLMKVFRDQIITGGSNGLKAIAPMAGFAWDDSDARGDNSMAWHNGALHDPDDAVRTRLREQLVRYNSDDVHATAAVRTWMRTTEFPPIDAQTSP